MRLLGRSRLIVGAALALYVASLGIVWRYASANAERRIIEMLDSAVSGYAATIQGEIEAALRNASGALINHFGGRCEPHSVAKMRTLAETFNVDEINLVDSSGLTVASSDPLCVGFDFHAAPETRAFLVLTNGAHSIVSQPFRRGVANPGRVCWYFGVAFPDRAGILQVGMGAERLRQNMYSYSEAEADKVLREWHFSVRGWFERADRDSAFEEGRRFRRTDPVTGERLIGVYFRYLRFQYRAVIPESFCYVQRNATFGVSAAVLAALIGLFTLILLRLERASARVAALHAAAEARRADDLALARKIQMSSLPDAAVSFPDKLEFAFEAASVPAREVGGDFYDFCRLPDGKVAFFVADVAGKGIPAAMFMMEAKGVLKTCLAAFADLAEAVEKANARLCENNEAEMFVTAWIGVLDARDGTVEYVNAGHCRPFVARADGTVEKVMGKGGLFLGMFDGATYRVHALALRPGDRLHLHTDGITEAMNERSEQFGEARLAAALAAGNVEAALRTFVGNAPQSDDLTHLVLSWNGAPTIAERSFPCAEDSLAPVVAFLRSALAGVEAKTLARILNAADEVVANIVGYSGSADFTVSVETVRGRVRLTFSDAGREYNPLSHVDPDVTAPIESRPVGGLGLVMVKRLMDRVGYARENGRNVLRMTKGVGRA